jgi:hypothetical protein
VHIIYERNAAWNAVYIDSAEPKRDMPRGAATDPRVPVCGERAWGTDGSEFHCTRAPGHPDDFHQAVYDRYRYDGPVGHVGLVWEDAWNGAGGPTTEDPAVTLTITVTAPRHLLDSITAEQHATAIRELFWEDDHDHITITTTR